MQIKKLEVVGFKSFLEKTSFSFNVPITAVVGPNGCGKSNIVDAIKWVTGELSYKELRGRSMEDLIFAGSETRPPISMMEVTLTLDNRDQKGPSEFQEFSEIAVMRRIFRDGTSEFYINKVPCRLRDIIDLFLDTGIGQSSYSIIEQGKVGAIVSGRPDDRRLVIEEAAGITKFKHRKKAAQRKMEYTKQNLLRVTDVLTELKRQIGSLERQARAAERFRKARDEARTLDISLASRDFLELQDHLGKLQQSETAIGQQWTDEETEFTAREGFHERLRLEVLESEKALEEAQASLFTFSSAIASLEARMDGNRREMTQLEKTAELEHQRISLLTDRRTSFATEIEELRMQLTLLESERCNVESALAEAQGAFASVSGDEGSELTDLERKNDALMELIAREAESRNQFQTQTDRLAKTDEQIVSAREKVVQTQAQLRELETLYQKEKHSLGEAEALRSTLENDRDEVQRRLTSTTEEKRQRTETLEKLHRELEGNRSRFKALEEFTETYQGYRQGVQAVMKNRPNVLGLLGERIQPTRGYERAVQAALSEWIECIVVDSTHDALEAVDFLKGERQGRGAFLPKELRATNTLTSSLDQPGIVGRLIEHVSAPADCREGLEYLLQDVLLVTDLSSAITLRKNGVPERMVTMAGDLLSREGIIVGGDGSDERGILEVRQEIAELQETISSAEGRRNELERSAHELTEQISSTEVRLTDLEEKLEQQGQMAFEHEKGSHRMEETVRHAREAFNVAESELGRLTNERLDIEQQLRSFRSTNENFAETKKTLENDVALLEQRQNEAREALTTMKVRLASLCERQDAFQRESDSLTEQDRAATEEITRLEESVLSHRTDVETKRIEVEHLDVERRTTIDLHQAQQEVHREIRTSHDEKVVTVQAGDSELKKHRADRDQLSEKLNQVRLSIREETLRGEHVTDALFERHAIRLPEWVTTAEFVSMKEEEVAAARDELQSLREKMAKIGDVNLAAIEEVRQLRERFDFLATQKEDLEQSLESLSMAIRKINATTKERFIETFEAVNERFQNIFPRLFGGGRAKVILLEPENILETGVDIVAQPPGKKLQNMNLLSGGEKALTAIALLFAIFEYKAPPFCVLDEVDAPLDDVNVRRFTKMVQEMSTRTQFIMITHNKVTMEAAENLYGITMEEPGVSRTVSVQVHQVADVEAVVENQSLSAQSVA